MCLTNYVCKINYLDFQKLYQNKLDQKAVVLLMSDGWFLTHEHSFVCFLMLDGWFLKHEHSFVCFLRFDGWFLKHEHSLVCFLISDGWFLKHEHSFFCSLISDSWFLKHEHSFVCFPTPNILWRFKTWNAFAKFFCQLSCSRRTYKRPLFLRWRFLISLLIAISIFNSLTDDFMVCLLFVVLFRNLTFLLVSRLMFCIVKTFSSCHFWYSRIC